MFIETCNELCYNPDKCVHGLKGVMRMKTAGRILKMYSRVIAGCIPLFVASGILSALSAEMFQNTYLAQMSGVLSYLVIPVFMGYRSGSVCGGDAGGLAGTLAASAIVLAEPASGMILAAIAGGMAGFLCEKGMKKLSNRIPAGFEMLFRNLYLTVVGLLTGALVYLLLVPAAEGAAGFLSYGLSDILARGVLPFISLLVEPLKIIFFNNWLNHGFFLPIGLEQVKAGGSSILFLLETNPGPGFGILLAYALVYREKRRELLSGLIIHSLGGIHEIYFPYILSDLRLLAAAIAGGIAGNYCFMLTGSGLLGPVSPGSILTILLMADKRHWLGVLAGIVLSAAVTCMLACLLLKQGRREVPDENTQTEEENTMQEKRGEQVRLYFVCDVGMGSSAMAGALFKRRIKLEEIPGVEVFHTSADRISPDADAIVCQANFARSLPPVNVRCFTVENLTDMSCYQELLDWLKGGG